MTPLRLAVIGVGHLGRIHARLALDHQDATLVGVVDPQDAARGATMRATHTAGYHDFRELLGQIDAAIVATPTESHHDVCLELLRHGIHVLVEKPIAVTVDQADAMVAAAREHGAILQVGHVERFNPAFTRLRESLGEPKYIDAVRVSGFPFRSTDIGVVLDLMIHDLDVALALVGSKVQRVEALGVAVLGQHEDAATARLAFDNGCIANFTASRVSYQSARVMQVWSSSGFASIDFGMRSTTVVRPREDILDRSFQLDALSGGDRSHLKQHLFDDLLVKQTIDGATGNALLEEQRDFVRAIRSGSEPQVTGQQGRDVLALATQICQGIEAHQWDGDAVGRTGPSALPSTPVLRPVYWDGENDDRKRRAG